MYKYLKGAGQIWVGSEPPPKEATNVLWLRFPIEFSEPFFQSRRVIFERNPDTGGIWTVFLNQEDVERVPLSELTSKGFELLVFVQNFNGDDGEWIPLQGTRGRRGPSGIVVQDTEPDDEEVKIWVDTSESAHNILVVEQTIDGESTNPVSQIAVKEAFDAFREELQENSALAPKSPYQIWLELGNIGTESDFITSLRGLSAYELDVLFNNYQGTLQEWLQEIRG